MEDYDNLLNSAYESVKPCEFCDRFEVKKVEGKHEGTRTIITNFSQIASCIRRDPLHLSKFLFKELASSGSIDGDRLILSRKISSGPINEKIQKYVDIFVKCKKCEKPDTELISENGGVFLRCMACGAKEEIHN